MLFKESRLVLFFSTKVKKNSNFALVYIVKTKSNLIITAVVNNKVIFVETTGSAIIGMLDRKFKRSLDAIKILGAKATSKLLEAGIINIRVFFKGLPFQRFFVLKEILAKNHFNLLSVSDITSLPHNGCSLRKQRRYKRHNKYRG